MTVTLSPRELRVAELVGQEMSDKEIGAELGISPSTVSNHLSSIAEKLRLRELGEPRRRGIRRWLARRIGREKQT